MIKILSLIIYFLLKLINLMFVKIFNRNLLVWIKYFIEQDSMKNKIKIK